MGRGRHATERSRRRKGRSKEKQKRRRSNRRRGRIRGGGSWGKKEKQEERKLEEEEEEKNEDKKEITTIKHEDETNRTRSSKRRIPMTHRMTHNPPSTGYVRRQALGGRPNDTHNSSNVDQQTCTPRKVQSQTRLPACPGPLSVSHKPVSKPRSCAKGGTP